MKMKRNIRKQGREGAEGTTTGGPLLRSQNARSRYKAGLLDTKNEIIYPERSGEPGQKPEKTA